VYTVKQLSDLANVSVRTLHYYDEIGLLHPSKVGANGYRYYDDAALLRLQQILFYREIGLELMHIKEILDSPDFDLLAALRSHRVVLQEKIKRLDKLVNTIDNTIMHLAEEVDMSKKQLFEAFSEEKQKHYERLARLHYGQARQDSIREEGGQIYRDLAAALEAGKSAKSAEVQAMIERWHQHLGYFYEPTLDVLRGLAGGYNSHPDFIAFFHHLHPDLPDYLNEAIIQYVDDLETAEIARMLAEDEANKING
jgi:DNA-binding transcriptional MerR regulator